MSVHALLNQFSSELPRSLQIFVPELILCGTMIVLLLVRMFEAHRKIPTSTVALLGSLIAFLAVFSQFMFLRVGVASNLLKALYDLFIVNSSGVGQPGVYFSGLLMHDPFAIFFRLGLTLFLVLVIALTMLSGIPDREDGQDFYTLLLGSTLGMLLATGTNHLLMLFIAVEMMSVPSYVMVAFQKGRRQASEAALKYVVYGAGAAGVMLYGISLIAGLLGTANLPLLANRVVQVLGEGNFHLTNPVAVTLVLGIMMVLVGLAFKLSLVPFHFWCPDAFEGASAEVCGFLSVASKAAAFALLVRFVLAFAGTAEVLRDLGMLFGLSLGAISILTMTLGNLAAYTQNNVKRMLAYSTIAHAGYMVMAVAAMLVIQNSSDTNPVNTLSNAAACLEGLIYYLGVYLFMNLAAFACVALIRNATFREDIEGYNGLISSSPSTALLCICLAISLFSLVGIPPFGGFFAKYQIFYAAFKAGYAHWFMWVVLVAGGFNTVFSLFYYLRIMRAMIIAEPDPANRHVTMAAPAGVFLLALTIPIVVLGASPLQDSLTSTAYQMAHALFQ